MKTLTFTLAALSLALASSSALAQSRRSQAYTGATNTRLTNFISLLEFDSSATGSPTSVSTDRLFTGLDGSENEQTMRFQGNARASADYGRLRAYARSEVTNSYHNESNAPFFDGETVNEDGSPDQVGSVSFAGFTDVLSFGGGAMAGYSARYVYFVEGVASGEPLSVSLFTTVAGQKQDFFIDVSGGRVAQYIVADPVPVSALTGQTAEVDFTVQALPTTFIVPDGSHILGEGEFSSTLTLAAIEIYDLQGNLVRGATATGASGTSYATVRPVPEPASMAALGLGALALLRRRRR